MIGKNHDFKYQNLIYLLIAVVLTAISVFYWFIRQQDLCIKTSQEIYHIIDLYRIKYDIDTRSVDSTYDVTPKPISGIDEVLHQISTFVAQQKVITMVVVSFPFKSPNHEAKTIGDLPDMAERKSLEYLQEMLNAIKMVYAPGAQLTIFCDGIYFAEFFGINQQTVMTYEAVLKSLVVDLPDLKLYTSTDIMHRYKFHNLDDIKKMIDTYPPSNDEFKASVQPITEIIRKRIALDLDYVDGRKILKQHKLDDIVFRLMVREARLRNFINNHFPSDKFIRLTVHFSKDLSKKIGIKLSPSSDITPYHGALVEEHGTWSIQFKKNVDTKNFKIMTKDINGIMCPYYTRP